MDNLANTRIVSTERRAVHASPSGATPAPGARDRSPRATRSTRAARGPRDDVATARWTLIGLFGLTGLTLSAWLARIPALRDALDVTPAQLGTVLVASSLGGLATMAVAPRLLTRFGHPGSMRGAAVLFTVAFSLMGAGAGTGSLALVAAGLFVNGVAFAGNNLTLNVGSAIVERRLGRPILPQFHAAFSIGTVAGSLLGAGAAALSVPLLAQFLVMALVALLWRLKAAPALIGDEDPAVPALISDEDAAAPAPARVPAGRARPERPLLAVWREPRSVLIGTVILAAVFSEFAANDWLALAVVDGLGAAESVAAAAFAAFVAAMTIVRLAGTRLLTRFGRVTVLRAGGLVSIAGATLFVLAPSVPLAVVGAFAWGAGAALNFPIAVSAMSDTPSRAAARISVLSMFAATAPLIEPIAIGALAEQAGVRTGLLAVVVVLVVVVVAARCVAPEHRGRTQDAPEPVAAAGATPTAGATPAAVA